MEVRDRQTLARVVRAREIAKVLWITLFLNWIIALLKLGVGLLTRCMVLVADGVHSFSDGTSNIVGLVGVSLSKHPADRDHPYGHQKYETLAAVGIGFFLFILAFGVLKEAIAGIVTPKNPEVTTASFVVMALSFIVNLFVVHYERGRGHELQSELLISDSWHTLSDIFVTLSVLLALLGIIFHIPLVDSIFSLGISGIIFFVAIGILKRSSDVLADKAVLDPSQIERIARGVEGVRDCHEVRTRGQNDDIYVDLHVLVDNEMTVLQSHHLANLIESNIRKQIPAVHDVVVHIEPVSHGHEELEG